MPTKAETRDGVKFFKWTIEIEVAECWVEDGFDFGEDRCLDLSESLIGWADPQEVKVRVTDAPDPQEVRKSQGYES